MTEYTALCVGGIVNKPVGLHSEVKDVLHLSQNMRNNFEVVQCTLLNKLISLGPLYFENAGQVVSME